METAGAVTTRFAMLMLYANGLHVLVWVCGCLCEWINGLMNCNSQNTVHFIDRLNHNLLGTSSSRVWNSDCSGTYCLLTLEKPYAEWTVFCVGWFLRPDLLLQVICKRFWENLVGFYKLYTTRQQPHACLHTHYSSHLCYVFHIISRGTLYLISRTFALRASPHQQYTRVYVATFDRIDVVWQYAAPHL